MVVLLVANVITGVVVYLITRHCCKKTIIKIVHPQPVMEDLYEDPDFQKNTTISVPMADNPAYGPDNTHIIYGNM